MSIAILGDAFVDLIVPLTNIKQGETYHRNIMTFTGGASNIAIQVSRLGEDAKYIGKVGTDPFGYFIKQNLRKENVEAFLFEDSKNPTGLCVSLACRDGERTMIAMRGANDYLSKEEILKCIDRIVGSKIVYASGYSLLSDKNSESIMYAVEEARNNNCEIYFNPGAPNIIRSHFKEIIRDFVDILALSFDEAKVISGKTKLDEISNELNEIAKVSIITLGERGCIVSTENRCVHVPTRRLDVKDSTGAGDAFISGFMVGRVRGLNLRECAELGNKTALSLLREKNKRIGKTGF